MDVRDAGVQLHDPSAIVAEGGRYFLYSTSYAHAKDMELGGGTLVIGAKDAHGNSASGHAGVLELRHASNRSDRRLVLSSHYYLAHGDGRGLSFLQWHELEYDAAGWPRLGARHVPKLRL